MYCFSIKDLRLALEELGNNNEQGEYYLTDTLGILIGKGHRVGALKIADSAEVLGINDRVQLYEAQEIMRKRILQRFMRSGVTIVDPGSTFIDEDAEIGIDTVLYPGTIIEGSTKIGEDCIIGPNSRLVGCIIENDVEIDSSIVLESFIGSNTKVGPFAYIRPESRIGSKVKIGDFVEIKKSVIGDKTKIPHLAYIGDSEIGRNANIACGVITVNYNGKHKNKTKVGDNAFVGCNVNLVAPVTVGSNTYIAAGSTITDEVPENSLAIARERQVVKEDWVLKKDMRRVEKD
jgi:bifunctional UDP-N-acetylglucosamine pyrophosphorylase/glucosamine-1-phosphate N-acetyltransferase